MASLPQRQLLEVVFYTKTRLLNGNLAQRASSLSTYRSARPRLLRLQWRYNRKITTQTQRLPFLRRVLSLFTTVFS